MIRRFQHHVVTPVFKYITVRCAHFDHIVMSKRKRPGFRDAFSGGHDDIRCFVCFVPEGSVLSDDVFYRPDFKYGPFQSSRIKDRRMHHIAKGIQVLRKPFQDRSLFFQPDDSFDRFVRHSDFLHCAGLGRCRCGHQQQQGEQEHPASQGFTPLIDHL